MRAPRQEPALTSRQYFTTLTMLLPGGGGSLATCTSLAFGAPPMTTAATLFEPAGAPVMERAAQVRTSTDCALLRNTGFCRKTETVLYDAVPVDALAPPSITTPAGGGDPGTASPVLFRNVLLYAAKLTVLNCTGATSVAMPAETPQPLSLLSN